MKTFDALLSFTENVINDLNVRYPGYDFKTIEGYRPGQPLSIAITKNGANVGSVLPANTLYDAYLKDGMKEVIKHIDNALASETPDFMNEISDTLMSWDLVKQKLTLHVYNLENVKKLSKNIVMEVFHDIASIPYIDFQEGFIAVNNQMLQSWGVEAADVFAIAKDNLKRHVSIKNMNTVLRELGGPDYMLEDNNPMFVATNEEGYHGGGVMLCKEVIGEFVKEYGPSYILPSSVHEVILLPEIMIDCSMYDFKHMVTSINMTEVADMDVLSNNVFYCNSEDGNVTLLMK